MMHFKMSPKPLNMTSVNHSFRSDGHYSEQPQDEADFDLFPFWQPSLTSILL